MSKFIPVEPNKWADMVRAQSEVLHLRRDAVHSANLIGGLQEENANLKAEVERLREAGDYIEVALRGMMGNYPRSLAEGWKEAKEGKRRG